MTPEEDTQVVLLDYLEDQPPIHLEVDVKTAVLLINNLQLALRHPDNTREASRVIREFARDLQERIAPVGSDLHNAMEMGWEEYD